MTLERSGNTHSWIRLTEREHNRVTLNRIERELEKVRETGVDFVTTPKLKEISDMCSPWHTLSTAGIRWLIYNGFLKAGKIGYHWAITIDSIKGFITLLRAKNEENMRKDEIRRGESNDSVP